LFGAAVLFLLSLLLAGRLSINFTRNSAETSPAGVELLTSGWADGKITRVRSSSDA
jgi:hypothetical protein